MTTANLFSRVTSYLDEAKRTYDVKDKDEGWVIFLNIKGYLRKNWPIVITVVNGYLDAEISVHSNYPEPILEINRLKVAEQITQINFGLTVGNFALCMDTGLLLFKSDLDLANGFLTKLMFGRMISQHLSVIKDFSAQIVSVGLDGEILPI